ncbi:hypothetical protein [Bacillus sp. FJAT-27245]|uniref:hypothetical protein n=1 Tax=Bacillus sp. FJAT-27245 TaxID=1684144 RepID=UPI0006A7BFBA|nr:hypothetical protein [Bacillus sp. FJAT-27245]
MEKFPDKAGKLPDKKEKLPDKTEKSPGIASSLLANTNQTSDKLKNFLQKRGRATWQALFFMFIKTSYKKMIPSSELNFDVHMV